MRKWVTQKDAHVDRAACPWLIRKYIDPKSEFLFVSPDQVQKIAKEENALPFDTKGVELGHHGSDFSFETIIKKYKIIDPALDDVEKIVRSRDIGNDIDKSPEACGLEVISHGQIFVMKDEYEAIKRRAFLHDCL